MAAFPERLNEQVAYEFAASQQYVAIAVWFDAETLPLLAAHFYRQAVEERNHAMMIVQFLLDSDHEVVIPAVEAPKTTFGDAREPVALALDQEKRVTEQIAALAALAREENDLVGEQFLHWFLQEQREEVSSMSALLSVVERASESNILLAEDYLSRNPVGDQGEAANAPACGGSLLVTTATPTSRAHADRAWPAAWPGVGVAERARHEILDVRAPRRRAQTGGGVSSRAGRERS